MPFRDKDQGGIFKSTHCACRVRVTAEDSLFTCYGYYKLELNLKICFESISVLPKYY